MRVRGGAVFAQSLAPAGYLAQHFWSFNKPPAAGLKLSSARWRLFPFNFDNSSSFWLSSEKKPNRDNRQISCNRPKAWYLSGLSFVPNVASWMPCASLCLPLIYSFLIHSLGRGNQSCSKSSIYVLKLCLLYFPLEQKGLPVPQKGPM